MKSLSEGQRQRRRDLDEQLRLGMPPSSPGMFLSGRYSGAERTKQTVNNDSSDRIRKGSPLGEAAPSESSQTSRTDADRAGDLLGAARSVFPASLFPGTRKLYSFDVHGRRSEIDTSQMSLPAYQKLVEAFQQASRLENPIVESCPAPLPGCKIGPETGLPVPDWWELPGEETTSEELQALMLRNLERAATNGNGPLVRDFPRGGEGGER